MLNLMRNVLLNISASTQSAEVSETLQQAIPEEFTPLAYTPSTERIRRALLPGVSLDEQAFGAHKVLQLLFAHPVEVFARGINTVFSFDPKDTVASFGEGLTYNIVDIDKRVVTALNQSRFLAEVQRSIPDSVFRGLQQILVSAKGALDRVACVALMFELLTAKLLGKLHGG